MARVVLQRHGYAVLEAEAASAALELWRTHHSSIDLLMTDLVMPGGLSGPDLAAQLTASKPSLKVIYTSGYANDSLAQRLGHEAGRTFLQKPYTALDLATSVRRYLDGAQRKA